MSGIDRIKPFGFANYESLFTCLKSKTTLEKNNTIKNTQKQQHVDINYYMP